MKIPFNKPLTSRLLDGLDAEDLSAILRAAKVQRFSAKSVVVNQAAAAKHLFLLTHGHARHFFITDDGEKILLRWLVPGDITGAATLLSKPSRYQMGTEVPRDSRFLVWDRITVGHLTNRYPCAFGEAAQRSRLLVIATPIWFARRRALSRSRR
jgi:CRP-like cAMP-binding protein